MKEEHTNYINIYKTFTVREFRSACSSLKNEDLPVILFKHKTPFFVVMSFDEAANLWDISDYNPEILAEENDIFRHYIQFTGRNPEAILQKARESEGYEPKEPKKQGNKSLSFDEFRARYGVSLEKLKP